VLGLVGAGMQSRTQLLAIQEVVSLKEVRVCDARPEAAQTFASEMAVKTRAKIVVVPGVEQCVKGADVVSTITPSRSPIVKSEWVGEGMHLNCVGADAAGKQELESSILNRAKVVVDNREQAVHSGEINVPISSGLFKENQIVAELVQVVRGENKVRYSPDDLTLFVSTGLAIQDLAVASMVYEAAKAKRIGVTTEFV